MSLSRMVRFIKRQMIKHPITVTLVLIAVSYVACVFVIAWCEQTDFADAVFKGIPAFMGELGEVESGSTIVKTAVIVSLILSLAFVTVLTAKVTTVFVEFCRKGGIVVEKVDFSNHVIICGWNFQGDRIVRELLSSTSGGVLGIRSAILIAMTAPSFVRIS